MARMRLFMSLGIILAMAATAFGSSAAPKKPKKKPKDTAASAPADPPKDAEPFNRDAAVNVLTSVDLGKCKTPNAARGEGHIAVRFSPNGAAVEASVDKGPMIGTPAAKCIANQFKKQAKVPAFAGDPVLVGKLFKFE